MEKFIAKYHNARDGQLVLNLENKEEKRDREKGYVLKLALFLVVPGTMISMTKAEVGLNVETDVIVYSLRF